MDTTESRQKRFAPPNNRVELPALSPAFVSPDDAARFAHQLIGDYRSVEYGGLILKDQASLYYATRPVRGKVGSFDPSLVLCTDEKGLFIHPPGYSCIALYHSHPANYGALKQAFTQWRAGEVHTAVNTFSSADIFLNRRNAYFASAHYLSGVNGSLIRYAASGSSAELALAKRIDDDTQAGVWTFKNAVEYTRAAAAVGELRVIQSTEVWAAKVGIVGGDYTAFVARPLLDIAPVIIQQPAFGPTCASVELALKDMRARIHQAHEKLYGFILKHNTQGFFVASEPVLGETDFSLCRFFGCDSAGKARIPVTYEIVGLYCSDGLYRDPSLLPAEEAAIFKNFVHPDTLANGVKAAQALTGPSARRAPALYIATRDGALLEYVSTFASTEQKFLAPLPVADGQGLAVLRDLLAGVYKPTTYIRDVAQAGELSVLHPSELWRDTGRVTANWQAYKDFYRRELGPSFVSCDDAARYAHKVIAKRTDRVYGGLIYKRLDNRFVATEPVRVKNETFDPTMMFPPELLKFVPHGCSVEAVYHTHRVRALQLWRSADEEQLNRNMLYPHELYDAIKNREWAGARYFSTQNGTLLKYTPSGSAQEISLLTQLAPPTLTPEKVHSNTMAMALRGNSVKPSQFIAQVAQAGDLRVVVGSALWGPAGKIGPSWKPKPAALPASPVLARLSPIFSQSEDAVRYAHRQMGARASAQYGVILRSNSEEYVATLPRAADDFRLSDLFGLDEQTGELGLPSGFQLHGFYVGAPKDIGISGHLANKRVYEAFIAPTLMIRALRFAMDLKEQIVLLGNATAFYISTADDALLRFISTFDAVQLESGLFKQSGQHLLDQLTSGRLTPLEYVRQVAMAGRLEVVQSNPVWTRLGGVSGGWQPFGAEEGLKPARDIRVFPASPVFSHPDDAVRHVHRQLKRPHTLNIMGCVLRDPTYGTYVALDPVANGEPVNTAEMILKTHRYQASGSPRAVLPTGYSQVSLHFSRDVRAMGAATEIDTQLVRNIPWPEDLCYAFVSLAQVHKDVEFVYVSTDDGGLLRYWRGNEQATFALCNRVIGYGWTAEGYFVENAQPLPFPTPPSEILRGLLNSGGLRVLISSDSWPLKGVISHTHTIATVPLALDYESTTPGQPVAHLTVGRLRDEL